MDPETGQYVRHESRVAQGESVVTFDVAVDGDTLRYASSLGDVRREIELDPEVVLDNPLRVSPRVRPLLDGDVGELVLPVFDILEGEAHETRFTRVGDERTIYLADASVTKRVEMASLDSTILSPAGVRIDDARRITSMRVRAALEPTGQRFDGTVEGNRIDGVFEIAHVRYDGAFGQHAWNEVYMGRAAGWVPLDTTAREVDFLDSGHIRIGELSSSSISFNAVEMEILEHTVRPARSAAESHGPPR